MWINEDHPHRRYEDKRKEFYMRILLKAIVLTVVALFIGLSLRPAHAFENLRFEIGASKAEMGNAGDNMWQDSTYPHTTNLHPWGGQIGASADVNNWLGWRASLVYFGKTKNSAVWPNDSDFFAHNGAPAIFRGEGTGQAYGITLAPTFNYRPTKESELSLEGGALIYRAAWTEQVASIDPETGAQTSAWTPMQTGWKTDVTPYYGVTARYSNFFVSFRRYRHVEGIDTVFGNAAQQYTAGISYAF